MVDSSPDAVGSCSGLPERIDRYELVLPIGAGGMATVYLGRLRGLGGFSRDVAVKVMHEGLRSVLGGTLDPLHEARLAARIRHPNVVPVLDVGDSPVGIYLVMEYVEGESLAGLCNAAASSKQRIPRPIAMRILADALAGLHAVHELCDDGGQPLRIVHRDFSPANILVGLDGTTRLTDFGIAKATHHKSFTEPGLIKGKVKYMSPEQASGYDIDRRSDVWAAGVIAWELLVGRRLFPEADDVAALLRLVAEKPPRLREVLPDVPRDLDEVVAHALTKDVAARCATAEELRQSLLNTCKSDGLLADTSEVAAYARTVAGAKLGERRRAIETVLSRRSQADTGQRPNENPTRVDSDRAPDSVKSGAFGPGSGKTLVGRLIGGKYRLLRRMDAGGMGTVFEAVHEATRRHVAVKLLSSLMAGANADASDLSDSLRQTRETVRARFEREAVAAGAIDSDHVVQILDAGTDEASDRPYLVMEMLVGEDLRALTDRLGPLPQELALRIVAQACAGMAKAHAAGVIHRDIKLGNLFLAKRDPDRRVVKLLDFGIAKISMDELQAAPKKGLTHSGSMLGSPHYMSPEQAQGLRSIDHRTDIWSLGVVLYRCLTGHNPFEAESLGQVILAICSKQPRPVQHLAPWVSTGVAKIVHSAMQRAPRDRFQSAAEMLAALEAELPNGRELRDDLIEPLPEELRALIPPRRTPDRPREDESDPLASARSSDSTEIGRRRRRGGTARVAVLTTAGVIATAVVGWGAVRTVRSSGPAPSSLQADASTNPSASVSAPAPIDSSERTARVTISPDDATVEIDGQTVQTVRGAVDVRGPLGSRHRVHIRQGDREQTTDIVVAEQGADPPIIALASGTASAPSPVTQTSALGHSVRAREPVRASSGGTTSPGGHAPRADPSASPTTPPPRASASAMDMHDAFE